MSTSTVIELNTRQRIVLKMIARYRREGSEFWSDLTAWRHIGTFPDRKAFRSLRTAGVVETRKGRAWREWRLTDDGRAIVEGMA